MWSDALRHLGPLRAGDGSRSGGSVKMRPALSFCVFRIDNIGKVGFIAETETSQSAADQLNLLHFQTDQSKRAFDRAALRND